MKIDAFVSWIHACCEPLSSHQKRILFVLTIFFSVIFIFFLLKGLLAFALGQKKGAPVPLLVRQGNEIIIPEGSALRSQLFMQTVRFSSRSHVVSFPGLVDAEPSRMVNILPPFTGRLIRLKVKLGENVKRNQVLAVLRSPPLTQAYSDHDKARASLSLATTTLARVKKVYRAGGNSIKDVEAAESFYLQAVADLKRAEALLTVLGKNGSRGLLEIKAPIDGRITALNYGIGSYINDVTAPVFSISNIKSVWVVANIPETLVGAVAERQPVEISLPAYPNHKWYGRVTFVNSFLEPDTRRNRTRIVFSNPNGKLQPNMFAVVNIMTSQAKQLVIPLSAILMNDDTTSVYVETKPWVFKRRAVELGSEDGDHVRVLSGLKSGERVVTSGGIFVND